VKIRLHGTEAECRTMTELLEQVMTVQAVSEPYPDRGRSVLVRVYVEGTPPAAAAPPEPEFSPCGPGTAQGSYTRPSPALWQNPRKENRQ
jgi:hypothetical protein